jgi:hypothetical protein
VDALLLDPTSTLYRTLAGDAWSLADHLLALIHDQLAIANWQRTKDGAKGRRRPKPLSPLAKDRGVRYGQTDRAPEEIKAYLARFGPPPS